MTFGCTKTSYVLWDLGPAKTLQPNFGFVSVTNKNFDKNSPCWIEKKQPTDHLLVQNLHTMTTKNTKNVGWKDQSYDTLPHCCWHLYLVPTISMALLWNAIARSPIQGPPPSNCSSICCQIWPVLCKRRARQTPPCVDLGGGTSQSWRLLLVLEASMGLAPHTFPTTAMSFSCFQIILPSTATLVLLLVVIAAAIAASVCTSRLCCNDTANLTTGITWCINHMVWSKSDCCRYQQRHTICCALCCGLYG